MIVKLVLYTVLFGNFLYSTVQGENYCDPDLCLESSHIACNNNRDYGPKCGRDVETITFGQSLVDYVLDAINTKRNETAGGTHGLPKAVRMPLVKWDDELEELAILHTKTCQLAHDKCRNTRQFRYAGQNVFKFTSNGVPIFEELIDDAIGSWYNEVELVEKSDIASYPLKTPGRVIGRYTQLVGERANRVGCGLTQWTEDEQYSFIFTCNFSSGNIANYPVYRSGPVAGSECERRDKTFTNCCHADETIDPNKLLKND